MNCEFYKLNSSYLRYFTVVCTFSIRARRPYVPRLPQRYGTEIYGFQRDAWYGTLTSTVSLNVLQLSRVACRPRLSGSKSQRPEDDPHPQSLSTRGLVCFAPRLENRLPWPIQ